MNLEQDSGVAPRSWSVAGLLLAVSDALAARFGAVTVRGELSGFTRAASGHCYFTLKDADGEAAGLRCAMFRRAAAGLSLQPRDGMQVEVRGRLAVYEARGELQMVVEALRPLGAGSLYEEFLRLKAKLGAQGCFDAERKRKLPGFPRVLGVITSTAGAALHDVLTALERRAPHVRIVVYPSQVQGPDAPAALVSAFAQVARRAECDAVLLCRGGGSIDDLWAFNDERVVRAVLACPVPVVCGVGHETDVTLADLAADLRAATPTAAAELAAPPRAQLLTDLSRIADVLQRRMGQRMDVAAQRLDNVALRLQRPSRWLSGQGGRLELLRERSRAALAGAMRLAPVRLREREQAWQQAMRRSLAAEAGRLDHLQARVSSLDPRQVLARGYAWVEGGDGRPVTAAASLQPGMALRAQWADGQALVTVEHVTLRPAGRDRG